MFPLYLTAMERIVLRNVLESDLSELHRELADTNNWKFKEALREKQATLNKVFEALEKVRDDAEVTDDVIL